MDSLAIIQTIKEFTATLQDTNKLLYIIAESMTDQESSAAKQMAAKMAERQVSGVRSAGGDGGVDVQRYPCPNKSWLIARRHPGGREEVIYEDANGIQREVTIEEAEAIING